MKRARRFLAILTVVCLLVCSAFTLSACGGTGSGNKPTHSLMDDMAYKAWLADGNEGTIEDFYTWRKYGHTHNEYHDAWSYDEEYHWHAPVCTEHDVAVKDSAKHDFDRGICKVCGYTTGGEDGVVVGGVAPSAFVANRADDRADAYSAYDVNGIKIGDYKTIATAVNAAVFNDYDTGIFDRASGWSIQGSYVTDLDNPSGFKHFVNRNGYAPGNDDQFWYYKNGNELVNYDHYDDGIMNILRDSKDVVIRNTGYGTRSLQYYNGYALLGEGGDLLPSSKSAQRWELSSTMDAAMLQYTARLKGVSGLDYTFDMSSVKITPSYNGIDTYAFMGFYVWQDLYVVVLGIACDTKTGNWYPFEATSRDDSFSDAKYNLGDSCLFTSTWNASGGYFTPDASKVDMSIHTVCRTVDKVATQSDKFMVTVDNGAVYRRALTNSNLGEFFEGRKLGWDNGYHFVAGLDVKNKVATEVFTEATDYFNGAKFENLTVDRATVRFGGDELERLSSRKIKNSWKDKDFNLVMASGDHEEGITDYTILNTYAFTYYEAKNGKDVYSFRYDGDPVAF